MIDDLLGLDLGPTSAPAAAAPAQPAPTGGVDLLSGGLDQLLDFGGGAPAQPAAPVRDRKAKTTFNFISCFFPSIGIFIRMEINDFGSFI